MNQASAMAPYVQLYTDSQYKRIYELPGWTQGVFLVILIVGMLAVAAAASRTYDDDCNHQLKAVGKAFGKLILGSVIVLSIGFAGESYNYAHSQPPERTGYVVDDNVALIEKAYGIRNIQSEDPRIEENSDETMIERFATPASNKEPIRIAFTADSETGNGILHITLEKDPGNLVRAYEGTGDTQHLITPAAHADNTRQKGQS